MCQLITDYEFPDGHIFSLAYLADHHSELIAKMFFGLDFARLCSNKIIEQDFFLLQYISKESVPVYKELQWFFSCSL